MRGIIGPLMWSSSMHKLGREMILLPDTKCFGLWALMLVWCAALCTANPISFVFNFEQVPIAKPSDLLYERELPNGRYEVEIIEAERRFFCVCDQRASFSLSLCNIMRMYKWVHGIKFQVICLPNGMIGNLAGMVPNLGSLHCHV